MPTPRPDSPALRTLPSSLHTLPTPPRPPPRTTRFVPNGGRLYYTERSQPPLLSEMVCDVYSARPDDDFLTRALPSLVRTSPPPGGGGLRESKLYRKTRNVPHTTLGCIIDPAGTAVSFG